LALRAWDGEWVVHVGPSNDTHRLSPEAACVLQIVATRPRSTTAEIAADVGVAPEKVEALLHALARAGIVGKC
jgi:PqqD family protein of HPr-rel-A system